MPSRSSTRATGWMLPEATADWISASVRQFSCAHAGASSIALTRATERTVNRRRVMSVMADQYLSIPEPHLNKAKMRSRLGCSRLDALAQEDDGKAFRDQLHSGGAGKSRH